VQRRAGYEGSYSPTSRAKTDAGAVKAPAKVENKRSTIEKEFRLSLFPGTLPTDNPDNVTVLDCEIIFALCGY
jgi:hypothetical protein